MSNPISRRTFVQGAVTTGALAGLPTLSACSKSPTSGGAGGGAADAGGGDELTVVALSEYTGIYAELGEEIRQGVDLIKEEYAGKVGDFKLNFATA
jgi:hypothetical protein